MRSGPFPLCQKQLQARGPVLAASLVATRRTGGNPKCRCAPDGQITTFAWLTNWAVNPDSVIAIADQVGRLRVKIENEGFNVQKKGRGFRVDH